MNDHYYSQFKRGTIARQLLRQYRDMSFTEQCRIGFFTGFISTCEDQPTHRSTGVQNGIGLPFADIEYLHFADNSIISIHDYSNRLEVNLSF